MKIPKYLIVYKLWKEGKDYKEIAIKLYGKNTEEIYNRVKALKWYAERSLSKKFLQFVDCSQTVLNEKTGELVCLESGEVVTDRLPLSFFKEEFLKDSYPTFHSHLGPSSEFSKMKLKAMVSPPGGKDDYEGKALLEVFGFLDELVSYLNVRSENVKQEAALIIRVNKDLIFNDKEKLVAASLLISLLIHDGLRNLSKFINVLEIYGIGINEVIEFIKNMKLKTTHVSALIKSFIRYEFLHH